MLLPIASFCALVAYSIVSSQTFMYVLALTRAQQSAGAPAWIEFRHLIDREMRSRYRVALYAALVCCLVLLTVAAYEQAGLRMAAAGLALAALGADIVITLKRSMPVNDIINGWTPTHYPADWATHRAAWFAAYRQRQYINAAGFAVLLAGVVFG